MYSKRSPPTAPAGIESPYISIPGSRGITPSTGSSRLRRYSSMGMVTDVGGVSIEETLPGRGWELQCQDERGPRGDHPSRTGHLFKKKKVDNTFLGQNGRF